MGALCALSKHFKCITPYSSPYTAGTVTIIIWQAMKLRPGEVQQLAHITERVSE